MFNKAIEIIKDAKLDQLIINESKRQKPILGICLGMQLLMSSSTENGYSKGLNLIKGDVKRFVSQKKYRVPHVGWNNVSFKDDHLLFNIEKNSDFYFDHSFYVNIHQKHILGISNYIIKFPSIIKKNNLYGVQFHPERSQIYGMKLLKNFSNICGIEID